MFLVSVDIQKCKGCGGCVIICPRDVFELQQEGASAVKMRDCVYCESCLSVCPAEALTIADI